ncbi:hypothetical protein [Planktotalea sp.]|uniref:hypothetical protein n=1 Tax=Planktotalea sp. TaxID=2029877 RepID=UPI00329A3D37
MKFVLPLLASLIGAPLSAAPMSGDAFEAYTQGKTLYFNENGETYGAERYLPGRRVEWSFLDGICKSGEWYPENGAICFVYEDRPDPQCWEFELSSRGLTATYLGDGETSELYEAQQTDEPMHCIGPDVGV